MATSYKSLAIAAEVADKLTKRLAPAAVAVAQLTDKNGFPLIKVGTGTDGDPGCLIRVKPIAWELAKDVLGLDSSVYTPHVVQIATESDAGAAVGDLGLTGWDVLAPVLAECFKAGTRVECYATAANTGVGNMVTDVQTNAEGAQSTYTSSTLKATVEFDLYQQMLASQ